jgi:hypothetical protein
MAGSAEATRSGAEAIPATHDRHLVTALMDGRHTLRFAPRWPAMTDWRMMG